MKNLIYKRKILTNAKNTIKEFAVELFKFTFNKKNFSSYLFNMYKRNSNYRSAQTKVGQIFIHLTQAKFTFFLS